MEKTRGVVLGTVGAFVLLALVLYLVPADVLVLAGYPRFVTLLFLFPFYLVILGCFIPDFRGYLVRLFSQERYIVLYLLFIGLWGSLWLFLCGKFRFYHLPFIVVAYGIPLYVSRNWGKGLSWKDILLAIYLAVIAQSSVLGGDGGHFLLGGYPYLIAMSFAHLAALATTLLLYLVIRQVDLGYRLDLDWREVVLSLGLIVGLLVLLVPVALAWGFLTPSATALNWRHFFVATVFFLFSSSLGEEILARGILQRYLSSLWPTRPWYGILITSLVFGLGHVYSPKFAVLAFVASLAFGWIYYRTGKLASAVLVHGGMNVIWQLLYLWG